MRVGMILVDFIVFLPCESREVVYVLLPTGGGIVNYTHVIQMSLTMVPIDASEIARLILFAATTATILGLRLIGVGVGVIFGRWML